MRLTPRPYQTLGANHIAEFLRTAEPGACRMYAAPTGCGKSVIERLAQTQLEDCWIITPRDEIVLGILDKVDEFARYHDPAEFLIATPVKLRNMLAAGTLMRPPKYLIFDEGHHVSADTWEQIQLFCGMPPAVALTASPFRGTAKGTAAMKERWGEPIWILRFEEAARAGYVAVPEFSVLPLVDDDVVSIGGNGEFDVLSLTQVTVDRMGDLAEHARRWHDGIWDRSTLFSVPSSTCAERLANELQRRGMPAIAVTAETPKDVRQVAFKAVVERAIALIHINVISEGVDLPIRRLVDASPTLSPVRWLQQVGRATRPVPAGETRPEVVCTNRNIIRHGAVFEGCMPSSAVAEAAKLFGSFGRSGGFRALGLEALGRFKPCEVKSQTGVPVQFYNITSVQGIKSTEWACIVHPLYEDAIWAQRVHGVKADGSRDWGKWVPAKMPTDLVGFKSQPPSTVTEKQLAWWKRSARGVGLDDSYEPNRKQFAILPVLMDTKTRFRR